MEFGKSIFSSMDHPNSTYKISFEREKNCLSDLVYLKILQSFYIAKSIIGIPRADT